MIDFDTFTKMPKNVRDLGKLIVAKALKKSPNLVTLDATTLTTNFTMPSTSQYNSLGHSLDYFNGH